MTAETNPTTPTERKRTGQLSGIQIMFAAILAVGLLLAINFSSRISAGQPLQDAYNSVLVEIEALQAEQAGLINQRDYVRSDAYVEQWARSEGGMVRPGEVLVIPVPLNNAPAAVETPVIRESVPVETSPPAPEPWLVWWALFFDSPAPQLD